GTPVVRALAGKPPVAPVGSTKLSNRKRHYTPPPHPGLGTALVSLRNIPFRMMFLVLAKACGHTRQGNGIKSAEPHSVTHP
ncbi:MAG: hypothetical protein JXA69_06840, partial [Phycisphaerae bacterium]|nr:hypothetical protein [Phycisphaerae bacterium]